MKSAWMAAGSGARSLSVSCSVPMPAATSAPAPTPALVTLLVTSVRVAAGARGGAGRFGAGTGTSSRRTRLLSWPPLLVQRLHLQLDQLMHLLLQRQFALAIASLLLVLPLGVGHQLGEVGILHEADALPWRALQHMLIEQQLLGCTVFCLQIIKCFYCLRWEFAQQLLLQCRRKLHTVPGGVNATGWEWLGSGCDFFLWWWLLLLWRRAMQLRRVKLNCWTRFAIDKFVIIIVVVLAWRTPCSVHCSRWSNCCRRSLLWAT